MRQNAIKILIPSGWGAQLSGCKKGPKSLKPHLKPPLILLEPDNTLLDPLSIILDLNRRLATSILSALQESKFPLVIGGDHSLAVGTWNAVAQYKKNFGLIWMDAHMDSHTFETSPSKAWHGMPLRALLDRNHTLSQKIALNPAHLCLIGVRSFEKEEFEFLKALKVRIFFMDEVKKYGLLAIFKEAVHYVNQGRDGFGISLDLDVLDPREAPGIGSPVYDGILAEDLLKCLTTIEDEDRLIAFEMVEFNPELDNNHKTLKLCLKIEKSLLYKSYYI